MSTILRLRHNWASPFIERWSYLTDVIASEDGTEDRVPLRVIPTRQVAMAVSADNNARHTQGLLDTLLTAGQDEDWRVPYWPGITRLTADATAGASVALQVEGTADRGFVNGGQAILWRDRSLPELVTITGLTGTTVTVATLAANWKANTLLLPALAGRWASDPSIERLSTAVGQTTLTFDLAHGTDPGVATPTEPALFDVARFTRRANPTDTVARRVDRLTSPTYTFQDFVRSDTPEGQRHTAPLWLPNRALVADLRAWFHGLKGSAGAFLLPTMQQDLEVLSGEGTDTITCAWVGYTDRLFPLATRRTLIAFEPDGTQTVLTVLDADGTGGIETLTLDAPLPLDTIQLSYGLTVRLASDTLELRWLAAEVAECVLEVVEVDGTTDEAPLELYRFSVGRASLPADTGDTTVEALTENFDQYVNIPDPEGFALLSAGDTAPPGVGDPTNVENVWGVVGPAAEAGGTIRAILDGLVGGDRSLELVYNNLSFRSQYFGGAYAYRRMSGFVVGDRYQATADLMASWNFLDPTIQGPCGWGVRSVSGPYAVTAFAGAASVGSLAPVTFSFVAPETELEVWFGWTYGNSNWADTRDNPRHLFCDNIGFERVTNNGDTDPTVFTPTVYGYTSADVEVTYNAETYTPAILVRSPFQSGTSEKSGAEVTVTLPRDHALATIAGGGPPRLPVSVEILRLNRSDLSTAITPWRGQVVGASFEGTSCTVRVASLRSLLDRKVPRFLTQRTCGYMLYDPSTCQASRQANTVGPLTVTDITGRTITVSGAGTAATGRVTGFAGGYVEAPNGLAHSIESASGDVLTLKSRPLGLAVSDAVHLVFGCDKRPETCDGDFHNMRHYGGEPVLPLRNPGEGAGLSAAGTAI